MHRLLLLAATLGLAGCAEAPRDMLLAGLDLNDPAVVARLGQELPQRERAALATFALLHWPGSKAYCGQQMFKGAAPPSTIGEAIDRTIEFDDALARKRIEEKQTTTFEQQARRKQQLVNEFDRLTLERDMLLSAGASSADDDGRLRELERQLAANRAARNEMTAVPALPIGPIQ